MLTGESIPVVKLPLKSSSDLYHPESISSRASTLYGGTVILQTRSGGAQGVQVRVKIFLCFKRVVRGCFSRPVVNQSKRNF